METADFVAYLRTIPKNKLAAAVQSLPEHVAAAILADLSKAQEGPTSRTYASPGELATALNKEIVNTPALERLDQALVEAYEHPERRKLINFAPQEGKSQRCSVAFPLWALNQNPDLRIIVASYSKDLAMGFTREARDLAREHAEVLGFEVADNPSRQDEWHVKGHRGGMYATGVGGTLSGKPADLIVVDDPHKDMKAAESKAERETVWSWWQSAVMARMSASVPVIVVQTRWTENDLTGMLLEHDPDTWSALRIPAQADHRPEKGESDPLGREPGEYMVSARGRTPAQWEQRKKDAGSRVWQALYQGSPSPAGGTIFNPEHFKTTGRQLFITSPSGARYLTNPTPDTEFIQSWDLAFKGTTTSDWVVGQVWLRVGAELHLIDQVRGRWGFSETQQQVLALTAKYPQALTKLIEDKANGPAIIDSLKKKVPGIVPVTPDGGKEARAHAVNPLIEAGNVHLPESAPWVGEFLEEAAAFPNGKHDDQVDAMTQALNRLMIRIFDKKNTGAPVALG